MLACVFLLAADGKRRSPGQLRQTLEALGWLPKPVIHVAVVSLPAVEAACAVMLLAPPARPWGGWASAALLTTFTAVTLAAVARGRAIDCGCFGSVASLPVSWLTVTRNAVLVVAAVVVALSAGSPGAGELPALLLGVGAGAAMVIEEQWRATVGPHWVRG